MTIYCPLPCFLSSSSAVSGRRRHHFSEPALFDDDEPLHSPPANSPELNRTRSSSVEITTCLEFPALPRSAASDDFTVLVHLKAPSAAGDSSSSSPASSWTSRASLDLVTVLDVSGSMAGTKLALLKRAMGFVIQHLGPNDRLSVVAFSSSARRLFPLRRLSAAGVQQALHAVNLLSAGGGTNIAEALRKGLKIFQDRKHRNTVCSLILLSDGQDTYSLSSSWAPAPDYRALLPRTGATAVHAFGFGADHDAALMHAVSELSGGTFSFIEAEAAIQDAFAQCIGGLLSVVVQKLRVDLECARPGTPIVSISSSAEIVDVAGRRGSIAVGDLYADEERDFLVTVAVPQMRSGERETELMRVATGTPWGRRQKRERKWRCCGWGGRIRWRSRGRPWWWTDRGTGSGRRRPWRRPARRQRGESLWRRWQRGERLCNRAPRRRISMRKQPSLRRRKRAREAQPLLLQLLAFRRRAVTHSLLHRDFFWSGDPVHRRERERENDERGRRTAWWRERETMKREEDNEERERQWRERKIMKRERDNEERGR